MLAKSRDYTLLLHEDLIKLAEKAVQEYGGIITEVWRSYQYQKCLYMQGRDILANVNACRERLGLPKITHNENKIVTTTLRSKHLIFLAFDVYFKDNIYREFADKEKPKSVVWGGIWTNIKDNMHFELLYKNTAKLQKAYTLVRNAEVKTLDDLLALREEVGKALGLL